LGTRPSFEFPLDTVFEAYERRNSRFRDIPHDNSAQRMGLRHRLDNFHQHLDRFQSSIGALGDSSIDGSLKEVKRARARRKKLRSYIHQDYEALKAQLGAVDVLTDKLRASDRRQEQAERSFANAVAQISTVLRQQKTTRPCIKGDLIESQSVRTSQPPIPCELEAYYGSVSTLRCVAERIRELEFEKQERLEPRGVTEDRGQVLDQSDHDFLRDWDKTLSVAYQDFEQARRDVASARKSCEDAGATMPAWAMTDNAEQRTHDDPGRMKVELSSLDGPEATLAYATPLESWQEFGNGRLVYLEIKDDHSIPQTKPARGKYLPDVRRKQPCDPSRLAGLCSTLIAAAVPLVTARANEAPVRDALPPPIEPDGSNSSLNSQNAAREALRTVFQYALAISPPIIVVGGIAGSAWIVTREKRAFEEQYYHLLMTFTASVSWWTLATLTRTGEQGSIVSISTWLALAAIYTSRNFRGLRNGTWHLFVALLGGLALTSLLALALLPAKDASMEGFIRTSLTVGPSVVTLWSWLAARSQWQLEGSVDAVAHETIELQGSTNTAPQ